MTFLSAHRARISRSLVTFFLLGLLQVSTGIVFESANAAAGNVGSTTASGTCSSGVGETAYVTADFINNSFCLLKFSTTTSWTAPVGITSIDILVVGAGGGGGADGGGGGGGGEVRQATGVSVTAGYTSTVTVGLGGAGQVWSSTAGAQGGSSGIVVNGTTYSAGGGVNGVGWQPDASYAAAGSGGANGVQITGGTNFSRGGRNSVQQDGYALGGYGTVGYDGVTTSFTGTSTTFAGGGGGGICTNTKSEASFGGLAGGAGGGGRGALHTKDVGSDNGQPGLNSYGGGGGGGSACNDGGVNGSNARTAGGRGGDGVVYIKYVPIISLYSSPQSATAAVGTTATFSASPFPTISGATRTKKWQVLVPGGTWTDIASSSSDSYTTPTATRSMHLNQYRYAVTDTSGTMVSTTYSAAATLSVPGPVLLGETDTAMTPYGTTYGTTTAAGGDSLTPSSSDAFTIEAWIYPTDACASTRCTIAAREGAYRFTYLANKISFVFWNGGSAPWQDNTTGTIPLNQWSHVALIKNGTTFNTYVNGVNSSTRTLTYAPSAGLTSSFLVGAINTVGNEYFIGSIDELRVWKTDRSASLASDMNSNETSTAGLVGYWNFNEGKDTTTYNQVLSAHVGTDITLGNANYWDATRISTSTTSGPYTVKKFLRSYITSAGGWKVPVGVSRITTLVVAGGGAGGRGDSTAYESGGGGAGGVLLQTLSVESTSVKSIVVGVGGYGGGTNPESGRNSYAFSLTAIGGGYGGYATGAGGSGGSGGGGSHNRSAGGSPTSGQGFAGETPATSSRGGGGGGATSSGLNGVGGTGLSSNISGASVTYGDGGGAGYNGGTNLAGGSGNGGRGSPSGSSGGDAVANTGSGGGGAYSSSNTVKGGNGGSGIVVVRWITASKPTYTQPTIAYLNVGMTETFTTNVASDSATAVLTRTFRWESTTPTSGGTYSLIKQGTGASNASFSWIPTDTSTSGSGYLYRVVVTDSDTSGLYIVDTSTPVYAVINKSLAVTGSSGISKTINLSKSETFTITLGTSTYRSVLMPFISGITLDTSTAGYAVLKISETLTVGTYYETLTVTDSVSASVTIPLTIRVQAPPSLSNIGELVESGTVLNLDASNSNSYPLTGATWNDISGRKLSTTFEKVFSATANYMDGSTRASNWLNVQGVTCSTPQYSKQYMGVFEFDSAAKNCGLVQNVRTQANYTYQTWIKRNGDQSVNAAVVASLYQNTSDHVTVALYWSGTNTLVAGIFNGSGWYTTSALTVANDVWTYISVTFDGTNLRMYANDVIGTSYSVVTTPFTWTGSLNSPDLIIGAKWDDKIYFKGSLASLRMYNRVLSSAEIIQNYSATKYRFLAQNQFQLIPTQKYGVLNLESFTTTSGGDTKTITFATGNRQGVIWDTASTPGQINLSVGESLTVGTYYDTVTVTDNFGASAYLPLTFTVKKADTITVTSGPSLTTVYSGTAVTNGPVARISGLVGKDTATVLTRYDTATVGKTCATGGTCRIGDTGPGGGVVFYVSDTPINKADGISDGGIYLEMHTTSINVNNWSSDPTSVPGTSASIGTGAENTRRAFTQLGSNSALMTTIANGTYGGKSDWFVPSLNEAMTMVSTLRNLGLGSFGNQNLWSSTEGTNSANAEQVWSSNPPVSGPLAKSGGYTVRPIRAFGGTTITPVDVDTYTAVGTNINFSIGTLDNYQAVTYETSTLKITQANQNKLSINLYGAMAGTPFLIQTSGGSGTGAVTETVTAGGTATNCTLSNHVLSNSSPNTVQVTCNIKVTKASSRNYFAESLDATVYFMLYVNNMPTNQVGSGSTIGLNGATSLTIDDSATVRAPLINSISISGTTVTINGEGFGSSAVSVKFERNVITSATPSGTDAAGIITVTLPVGARSGYVLVTLPSGAKATSPYLTLP